MALINCSECNKEFSSQASACPNCGCPTSSSIPREPFAITTEGNSYRINRPKSETLSIATTAVASIRLNYFAATDGMEVQGKTFGHNGAAVVISFVEDPISHSTLITFANSSSHFGTGAGRLAKDIVKAIQQTGSVS